MDDFASFGIGLVAVVFAAVLVWRERQAYMWRQRQIAKGKDLRP
ncbi:hypothetical protein HOS13_gp03 [Caulobacter phage Lullwater]|uniref:Uncharacterized protein n=1 Tax=Caulobacter phage Lullwater TaxID=2024607 RepID=A0A291LC11_9CAUD|nr:hypothetical protein HOS13_gp03 [Caulobacter phage Lullwater]ATI16310.1 hypothetical protein Lull_003 [Caulobacter phage Lullwater]